MRYVRIDDMPYGTPNNYDPATCRSVLEKVFAIFNKHYVPFIIGVIPLVVEPADLELLNRRLGVGRAVMHGFDHGFGRWREWVDITRSWPQGGEFVNMAEKEVNRRYRLARIVMDKIESVDHTQHIAPFNCYTQALLNVLNANGVTKIHTMDMQFNDYGYSKLDYGNCQPVIATWQKSYNFGFRIIGKPLDKAQLTLHWMYDVRQDGNWEMTYNKLCEQIIAEDQA